MIDNIFAPEAVVLVASIFFLLFVKEPDASSEKKSLNFKFKLARSAPTLAVLSLLITILMVILNVNIEPSESGINTAGIITSFVAGMSSYATLEFLRRGYLK